MTVRELNARLDGQELTEWAAYARLEPFGEERADVRAALVCKVVADVNRGPHDAPYPLTNFLPRYDAMDGWEERMEHIRHLNTLMGGRVRGTHR
jgi:hypothetical protein